MIMVKIKDGDDGIKAGKVYVDTNNAVNMFLKLLRGVHL